MKIFNGKKFIRMEVDTLGTEGQKAETNGGKTA